MSGIDVYKRQPLEVQREIVRLLDSFTLLTAELTAELTARKKQYEFYRDKLLSHDRNYPMKPLADLGKWSGGKTPSMSEKSFWEQGTKMCIRDSCKILCCSKSFTEKRSL